MNTIIKTGLGERLMFIQYFCVYIILHYIILCFCVFLIYQKKVPIHSPLNQQSQEPLWTLFFLRLGGLIFPLILQTTFIIRFFLHFLPFNQDAVSVACSQEILIQSSVLVLPILMIEMKIFLGQRGPLTWLSPSLEALKMPVTCGRGGLG